MSGEGFFIFSINLKQKNTPSWLAIPLSRWKVIRIYHVTHKEQRKRPWNSRKRCNGSFHDSLVHSQRSSSSTRRCQNGLCFLLVKNKYKTQITNWFIAYKFPALRLSLESIANVNLQLQKKEPSQLSGWWELIWAERGISAAAEEEPPHSISVFFEMHLETRHVENVNCARLELHSMAHVEWSGVEWRSIIKASQAPSQLKSKVDEKRHAVNNALHVIIFNNYIWR